MGHRSRESRSGYEGDSLLTWLREAEAALLRAIHGMGVFIYRKAPTLARRLASWLREACAYGWLVAVHGARVASLFLRWAALVFGTLYVYFGWITGAWCVLALAGSVWGLDRRLRHGQSVWSLWKEDVHA